ncbi:MAG: hypothetical protein M3454_11955, partial [Actinomycetota bacterium]|nr:hypothetical protein [Actinomycetota bacterium]
GVLAAVTAGIHLIAGHADTVRPLLASSLNEASKRTLHGCWHIASVVQAVSAVVLLYLAVFGGGASTDALARLIALNYFGFGLVFLAIALSVAWPKGLIRLPQWALLLPIAALAWWGTV